MPKSTDDDLDEFYETFGANVAKYRNKRGWTQEEFAVMIGMGRATVSNIEGGRHHVRFNKAVEIAEALEVKLSRLT